MRIIPVLDIKDGQVVRGVAGRRETYRPVVSRLTTSCRPADVALAFRDHFGLAELYLADLDAIAGAPPALSLYSELRASGFRLWVDAGIRHGTQASETAQAGVESIVLGLETDQGPDVLEAACSNLGPDRVVFSLDLKNGLPWGDTTSWGVSDPWSVASQAIRLGVRRLLVLDLARVGVGGGLGTEDLCARLAAAYPQVHLAAGGGVRDSADLDRLRESGVRAVLVASALHDSRLPRKVIDKYQESNHEIKGG